MTERPDLVWPGTGERLVWAKDGWPDAELPGTRVDIRWSKTFDAWVAYDGIEESQGVHPQEALNALHGFVVKRHAADAHLLDKKSPLDELPMPVEEYFSVDSPEAKATIWYPRCVGSGSSCFSSVEIDLIDVRAADSVRVSYDFERDGWRIEQASIFEWEADETEFDEGWAEVAFVQAWARQVIPDPDKQDGPG